MAFLAKNAVVLGERVFLTSDQINCFENADTQQKCCVEDQNEEEILYIEPYHDVWR